MKYLLPALVALGLACGANRRGDASAPLAKGAALPTRTLFLGTDETCQVGSTGNVRCWPHETGLEALHGVREIGIGYRYACARLADGAVACRGLDGCQGPD